MDTSSSADTIAQRARVVHWTKVSSIPSHRSRRSARPRGDVRSLAVSVAAQGWTTMRGSIEEPGGGAAMQSLRERYASLSRRERQGMTLVVSGLLNKQVGGELGISEITVKAHRGQGMRKMGADSLAGLVRMADWLGLPLTAADWSPVAMTAEVSAALSS